MSETKKILGVLGVLLILGGCTYILSLMKGSLPHSGNDATSANIVPPPFTDEVKAELAASKGFQVLVSYTDNGFEPATTTVQKGDTVRFTSNSSEDLWVASTGASGAVYPGTGKECGQSSFDTCHVLKHGEFWEFTFTTSGTWSYRNNRNTKMAGVVHVK